MKTPRIVDIGPVFKLLADTLQGTPGGLTDLVTTHEVDAILPHFTHQTGGFTPAWGFGGLPDAACAVRGEDPRSKSPPPARTRTCLAAAKMNFPKQRRVITSPS